jgi:hypothetical protein
MVPVGPLVANIVVIIAVVLWLLRVFGVLDAARGIRVGAAAPIVRLG